MNLKKYMGLAACALAMSASAQTTINFEDGTGYTSLGVYDSWADSPFMTGKLTGNFGIIDNPLLDTDDSNSTAKVLAFQRSRYGGNQYGVRIDLESPISLSSTKQYIHVLLYKEKEGRVMLTGLGTNINNEGQAETEQFNELTSNTLATGVWVDAVFGVTGADGAQVTSLVLVPDCESTHDLAEDFVVYVDEILVSSSASMRAGAGNYPVNVEEGATLSRTDRYTNTVSLTSPTAGEQSVTIDQQTSTLVYIDATSESVKAKPGETVTPTIGYNAWAMHGYVYVDYDNDGKFSFDLTEAGLPADGSDLKTFTYYNGVNSEGTTVSAPGSAGVNPPSFTIPADLTPGFYRMRYKVDWNDVDAGGSTASGNTITANGGVIADVRLNVHGDSVTIYRASGEDGVGGLNGDILKADGSEFTTEKVPFGETYTITYDPAPGFKLSHVILRHGYNLEGAATVFGTPQYTDERILASAFSKDTKSYTIPAEYMDGDVRLIPYFSVDDGDYYPINYDTDATLNRSDHGNDRYTSSIKLTSNDGTQAIALDQQTTQLLYNDVTSESFTAKAGESVTPAVVFSSSWMHTYVYLDKGQDGEFSYTITDAGIPADESDLVSFSCYNSMNSLGESASPGTAIQPVAFTIPASLTPGFYRMRYKVDWNSIDPGGNYNASGNNLITNNGGVIADTRLNVHEDSVTLSVVSENGTIYNADGEAIESVTIPFNTAYTINIVPAEGYVLSGLVLRHGYSLDGDIMYFGTQQYTDVTLDSTDFEDGTYTIPAAYVDGNVRLTPTYVVDPMLGITDAKANTSANAPLYDLSGRKMNGSVKSLPAGVYVKEGQKIMVK